MLRVRRIPRLLSGLLAFITLGCDKPAELGVIELTLPEDQGKRVELGVRSSFAEYVELPDRRNELRITLTSYEVGTLLALKGFAAAMLGGMGSPVGAVVGGLLVGLIEAFGAGLISSQYKDAFAFLVILAVLFFLPAGLFGRKSVERV